MRFAEKHATRLKCCACHAKWRWIRPKCCACHENCNASSENVTKKLHLPHKVTFGMLQNIPRETKQREDSNLPKWTPFVELVIGTAIGQSRERLRTVANDCGRKRNVKRTHPQPPDPQGKTGTLRIQEKGGAVCHLTFGFSGPPYFFPPHFQTIKAIFQNLLSNIVTTLPLQHLEVGKHCIPLNFKDKIYIFGKYIYIYKYFSSDYSTQIACPQKAKNNKNNKSLTLNP